MQLPGNFGVGSTGAAGYSVPIQVPPGTAGMAPSLSLSYSSQSGNGIVGMGWTLGGLPSIGRCAQTIAQDGKAGSITFTATDRFCLDGQRLVAISGTYGADGTEYRTEVDSFLRIISHGTAGNGPWSFQVWTKSGQVMELGNSTDTRILAQGTATARSWAMNKISDASGNYLTVTYNQNTATGEAYPVEIDYTGNTAAGLTPYNKVVFSYAARTDGITQYQAGSAIQTKQLLTNIRTYASGTLVFDYRLGYQQGLSGRSRLASLTLCQSDEATCLPPTSFTWDDGGDGTFTFGGASYGGWNFGSPPANSYSAVTGDFNGDGRTDTLLLGPTSYALMTRNSDGTFANHGATYTYNWDLGSPITANYTVVTGDFLGNGRSGAILLGPTAYYMLSGNADSSFTQSAAPYGLNWNFGAPPSTNWTVLTGDFNGNGRTDIIFLGATYYTLLTSNGDGTFSQSSASYPDGWNFGGNPSSTWSVQTGDFNGDGKTDIILLGNTSYCLLTSNGDGTFAPGGASYGGWGFGAPPWVGYTVLTGDFNGDGNTDVILLGANTYQLMTSKGDGSFSNTEAAYSGNQSFTSPPSQLWSIEAGDFDGDGKTDVMFLTNYGGFVMRSRGDGTFAPSANFSENWGLGIPASAAYTIVSGDFNGDGKTDIMALGATNYDIMTTKGLQPDLMTGITTGLGAQTEIGYAALDQFWLYTKNSSASYPVMDYTGPFYVTTSVNQTNNLGSLRQTAYLYNGAQMDLHGRGFLGFASVATLDGPTQLYAVQDYNQAFPWTGTVGMSATYLWKGSRSASQLLSSSYTAYVGCALAGTRYVVMPNTVTTSGFDLDGTVLPSTTTSYTYDFTNSAGACAGTTAYGDVTQIKSTSSEGFVNTTNNTYADIVDGSHWLLGRATQVQQINAGPSQTTITRTSTAAYDGNGRLTQQITEPTSAMWLKASYTYDGYGNKLAAATSGWDGAAQQSSTAYDGQGRFATSVTDGLGYRTQFQTDNRFGGVTSTTDPNNVTSTSGYDGFGRKLLDVAADGTRAIYVYTYSLASQSYGVACSVQVTPYAADGTTQIGPQKITFYDLLNRELVDQVQGFDGSLDRTQVAYDLFGNVAQRSRPFFFPNGTAQWTTYAYDILGRVTQSTAPDGTVATHAYHGEMTVDRNANSQTLTTTRNAEGQIVTVQDVLGNTTRYTWDTFGNMIATIDPVGNSVGMTYDLRGRLIQKQDPDVGTWAYTYNSLSQLTKTVDNKGQSSTVAYDALGRMTARIEPDLTSSWTYDTAANGIGKLAGSATNQGYALSLVYDALGRPVQSNQTTGAANPSFTIGYDAYSRITSIQYPSGFTLSRSYNAYGYPLGETESDTTQPGPLWTTIAMDAEMHQTAVGYGNAIQTQRGYNPQNGELQSIVSGHAGSVQALSYSYDPIGNVLSRVDSTQGLTESFGYDALNRLTSAQISGSAAVTYGYDKIGNLTSKSDVGTFTYAPTTGPQPQPHQIQGASVSSASPYAAAFAAGTERSYSWTSFNMPATVTDGGETIAFTYDSGHNRITQTTPEGITTYMRDPITGALQVRVIAGSTVVRRHYFAGGISIWTVVGTNPVTATIRYMHGDSLGSAVVLTDPSGAVVERDGYDAWGKRRYANGTSDPNGAITSQTDRGYTGQEQLDDVSLVHMNARLYDPLTGRFVSADPIGLAGGANAYAYAGNNPIGLSDPTGLAASLANAAAIRARNQAFADANEIANGGLNIVAAAVSQALSGEGSFLWHGANVPVVGVNGRIDSANLAAAAQNAYLVATYGNVARQAINIAAGSATAAAASGTATTLGVGGSANNGTGGANSDVSGPNGSFTNAGNNGVVTSDDACSYVHCAYNYSGNSATVTADRSTTEYGASAGGTAAFLSPGAGFGFGFGVSNYSGWRSWRGIQISTSLQVNVMGGVGTYYGAGAGIVRSTSSGPLPIGSFGVYRYGEADAGWYASATASIQGSQNILGPDHSWANDSIGSIGGSLPIFPLSRIGAGFGGYVGGGFTASGSLSSPTLGSIFQ